MRKLLLVMFALLLFFPVIPAQSEDIRFYHATGTNLTIFEKCRIDGGRCDSAFVCSATVLSPEQQLIINNETMEGPGVYYNITLNETQTAINGIHETTVDCTNGTNSGSDTFFYENTPNGSAPIDEGQSILLLGGLLILAVFAISVGWVGFRLNNGAVGLILICFSVLILVFSIGMITNIFQLSFGTFGEITDNYSSVFIVFIILTTMGGLGLILWLIVFALRLYWRNRGLTDPELE